MNAVDALGIDIGGTKIAGARVSPSGTVVYLAERPTTAEDPEGIVGAVASLVEELRGEDLLPIVGLAVAAFLNQERETIHFSPNISWLNFPIKAAVEKAIAAPVVIENDANAAGWGEFRFGAAHDVSSMVMLTVGTGVGGAVVDSGQLLVGGFGMGAELGHIIIDPGGRLCGCGNRGCLEQYASGTALLRDARERSGRESISQAELSALLLQGDQQALACLEGVGHALGRGIASIVAVTDPERIVIGGGLASAGELLLRPIRESFLEVYGAGSKRPVADIVAATMGNTAGVVGAAELARVALGTRG